MSFSQKVKKLLKENKMTKAELAKDAGIAYTTLDSMLKRETDTDRLATIFRIAEALGTSVEALIFDEEQKEISSEEKRLLSLYSLLDSRGKDTVLSLLEKEVDNSKEIRRSIPLYQAPCAAGEALPVYTDEKNDLVAVASEFPESASFSVRLSGDSMEPMLSDGDLVFVEKAEEISSGEIGIFILNGESLCKVFKKEENESFLVSLNPAYEPIHILESDDLRLVGKVIAQMESEENE